MLAILLVLVAGPFPVHPPGQWTTAHRLPEPLLEARAAVLRGKIYVAGGIDGSGAPTAHVYRYDPATDAWERVADLPAARHHMPLAVIGDSVLYAIAGFSGKEYRAERTLWAYHPDKNVWVARSELSRPRGAAAAVGVKGQLVVVGGLERIVDGGMADLTPIYDAAYNNWHNGWPILTKRDHLTAAVVDDIIYVIGGRLLNPDHNLTAVESYDPSRDRWAQLSPLPEPSGALGSAVLDRKVHVFGGESRSATFDLHEVYDPASNTWSSAAPLPTARHGVAAVALNGKIYVIGGGTRPGFSESDIVEVFTP
jgi:N-acetylneuraminic acid mutarotase